MPLLPIPFEACWETKAKEWNVFIPDLEVTKHLKTLDATQEKELRIRADNLAWRALSVKISVPSEFYWEASAWHDVFGKINDDENLRTDKRPYRFVETDNAGKLCVKTRIPDASFGIRAFSYWWLGLGGQAYRSDPKKKPEPMLEDRRLSEMMCNPQCGLVVDGMWGEEALIFPFAAYEAKSGCAYDAAEKQIKHACRTYLAMLDDLARNPNNVSEY